MQKFRYTFKKTERLRKKRHIDALFLAKEESFVSFPFRVLCTKITDDSKDTPAKLLISIPKRKIKKAADRNLLKRRTREAYRKRKHLLYDTLSENDDTLAIAFVYLSDKIVSYEIISNAVEEIIEKLKTRI